VKWFNSMGTPVSKRKREKHLEQREGKKEMGELDFW